MQKYLARMLVCFALVFTAPLGAQDPLPENEVAPQEPAAPAEPPPPEPEPPDAKLVQEFEKALSSGVDPANLVTVLRAANRLVWKHVDAGEPFPRERFVPIHPLLVDEQSTALARRIASEKVFARPVKIRLSVKEIREQEGGLVVTGEVTWRQRELSEYFDSSDRARLGKLNRAIAVLGEELREHEKSARDRSGRRREPEKDEVDEEIQTLLRELIRQALGDAPGETEPQDVIAIKELQLAEAREQVLEIYTAARQRKEYSESTRITAYVRPEPGQKIDVRGLTRSKRIKLVGMVAEGLIGRPFLLDDKPFLRHVVLAARLVEP